MSIRQTNTLYSLKLMGTYLLTEKKRERNRPVVTMTPKEIVFYSFICLYRGYLTLGRQFTVYIPSHGENLHKSYS